LDIYIYLRKENTKIGLSTGRRT